MTKSGWRRANIVKDLCLVHSFILFITLFDLGAVPWISVGNYNFLFPDYGPRDRATSEVVTRVVRLYST